MPARLIPHHRPSHYSAFVAQDPRDSPQPIEQLTECLLVLFVGWLAIGGVYVFQAFTLSRFETSVPENLRARRVHTPMEFSLHSDHHRCAS